MREYRRKRGLTKTSTGPMQRADHGTRSRYNTCTAGEDGGKCDSCRAANTSYQIMYQGGVTLTGERVPSRRPKWLDLPKEED